ncbi:hypothetical protein F385_70 [Pantoea agglomerans 299R]|nr:hypothetical protein F385_70 [Pantoea agglomerans 299R]
MNVFVKQVLHFNIPVRACSKIGIAQFYDKVNCSYFVPAAVFSY